MPIRTILLVLAFLASAAVTLTMLAGWLPVPLSLFGPFGGGLLYAAAALTVLLAFVIAWTWTGRGES